MVDDPIGVSTNNKAIHQKETTHTDAVHDRMWPGFEITEPGKMKTKQAACGAEHRSQY